MKRDYLLVPAKFNLAIYPCFVVEDLLFSEEVFCDVSRLGMERDQTYEQAVLKSVKLFDWSRKYNWNEDDFELASR